VLSQALAAQVASSVLQRVVQQLPLPFSPQIPDWQRSSAEQAAPSASKLEPVVVPVVAPPLVDPEPVPAPLLLAPVLPAAAPVEVELSSPLLLEHAAPQKKAKPTAAIIVFRML